MTIDIEQVPSPAFVLDEALLRKNLEIAKRIKKEAGIEIILAFKGFAMWSAFPLVREYIAGATASSLNEARLCFDKMKTKAHCYSPVYIPEEFDEIQSISSHITFNSLSQFHFFKSRLKPEYAISCGLRVNPECSDVEVDLYNPCALGSRLGATASQLQGGLPDGIEGLHFHALCESDSKSLEKVLFAFEEKFGHLLSKISWVNMGGGHLFTKEGYDIDHLIELLITFKNKFNVKIILEPGSAIAWNTGILVATVLDIVENHGIKTAMLNVSFAAHMPDTLEMPYRPRIYGAKDSANGPYTYRIGGLSCLSGDYMNEYSFEKELHIGHKIILEDMIHYTMVKTTMFNGVTHPDIGIWKENKIYELVKRFTYDDYKNRLS